MRRHLGALTIAAVACLLGIAAGAAGRADAAACPNESLRQEQQSTYLSECRAYERISPPDKNGVALPKIRTVQSSPDGNTVAFAANGSLAGAPASTSGGYYLSHRSAQGWTVEPADPPQGSTWRQLATPTRYFSTDFSRSFQFSSRALTPGAVENGGNLYLRDNRTDARSLVAATSDESLQAEMAPFTIRQLLGAADDLSTVVFQTRAQLLPDAAPGTMNAYEYSAGELRLLNRLPDGSVDPGGAQLASGSGTGLSYASRLVSTDGSRAVFQAPYAFGTEAPIYLRIDGETTIPVSVSHIPGDPQTPVAATYITGTSDLRYLFFYSTARLVEGADGAGAGNIYRYDVDSEDLELVTGFPHPGSEFAISGQLANSADGSRSYFLTQGSFDGSGEPTAQNVYFAEGDTLKHVATLPSTLYLLQPLTVAASPNGRYLAFSWAEDLTGQSEPTPRCGITEICTNLYVYDAEAETLSCVSCRPVDGIFANTATGIASALFGPNSTPSISEFHPQAMFDDGAVFFETEEALVRADSNGRSDVYRWQAGHFDLISSGKGESGAFFAGAAVGGRDVYFFSDDQLVGSDVDAETDLYVARVDGGITAQNEAGALAGSGCAGESCQPVSAVPPAPVPASQATSGPPDRRQRAHRKRHGRHQRKRHAHHHKKGSAKHADKSRNHSSRGGHR